MCLDGFKYGFLAGYKSFIGVDDCHLKTKLWWAIVSSSGQRSKWLVFSPCICCDGKLKQKDLGMVYDIVIEWHWGYPN